MIDKYSERVFTGKVRKWLLIIYIPADQGAGDERVAEERETDLAEREVHRAAFGVEHDGVPFALDSVHLVRTDPQAERTLLDLLADLFKILVGHLVDPVAVDRDVRAALDVSRDRFLRDRDQDDTGQNEHRRSDYHQHRHDRRKDTADLAYNFDFSR